MKAKSLKLNALAADELKQKEMEAVVGGLYACGCGCHETTRLVNSQTSSNGNANAAGGLHSRLYSWTTDGHGNWEPTFGDGYCVPVPQLPDSRRTEPIKIKEFDLPVLEID
ncbi:MAG: TIGR04149 family rSAM-modified RiPP [Bacteroidales bacterium]|nr:TIGR04149 family rSAM-modified RiPP [Bacteroidales bacterium]